MERPSEKPFSQYVSQRGIYTMSAVTYCNHMLIIPSCIKIVPAHSICSSLSISLFTDFSSFYIFPSRWPRLLHTSLYIGFLLLLSKLLTIHSFFLITFPLPSSFSFRLLSSATLSTDCESISVSTKALSLCYSCPLLSISAAQVSNTHTSEYFNTYST